MAEQLAYAEEKKEIERQRRELERLTADEEIRKTQAELDEEVKHSHSQRETLKQSLRSSWEVCSKQDLPFLPSPPPLSLSLSLHTEVVAVHDGIISLFLPFSSLLLCRLQCWV
mmetsp:Transcript_11986/g.32476  ORF Transcript_11986/g.32476 Transcript_11986/m.32476 type:complete len:113 (-) Transcript_11986:163-501(-)